LRQLPLGDEAQLPFPTQQFGTKGTYKLFGVVTNKTEAGDRVIWWLRARCGKSEQVHSELKTDLAGRQLPSAVFGANAAWWALAILAHNLNAAMKQLVLGKDWMSKRMKALRFHLLALPGRVISHARRLIIRLGCGAEALATIVAARQAIRALACGPAG
jgi:Transposase DDE domain group 1